MREWLKIQFDHVFDTLSVPDEWKMGKLNPLMKSCTGHPGDPTNRRPIMLMQNVLKIFNSILAERLQDVIEKEKLVGPEQFGFVRGRRIETPIAEAIGALEDAKISSTPIFMAGLDIAKAYDTVDFQALEAGLKDMNLGRRFIQYIRELYRNRKATILTGYGETKPFKIERGISQGDPLSCLLFVIFMERILKEIRGKFQGYQYKFVNHKVCALAFADDILIITENKEELQEICSRLVTKIREAGMEVNFKKVGLFNECER